MFIDTILRFSNVSLVFRPSRHTMHISFVCSLASYRVYGVCLCMCVFLVVTWSWFRVCKVKVLWTTSMHCRRNISPVKDIFATPNTFKWRQREIFYSLVFYFKFSRSLWHPLSGWTSRIFIGIDIEDNRRISLVFALFWTFARLLSLSLSFFVFFFFLSYFLLSLLFIFVFILSSSYSTFCQKLSPNFVTIHDLPFWYKRNFSFINRLLRYIETHAL